MNTITNLRRGVVALLLVVVHAGALAYTSADLTRIAAPTATPVTYLAGYNSRTGQIVQTCVEKVGPSQLKAGANEPGSSSFSLVQSMEDVMDAMSLDVAAQVKVAFGVGSASMGVEAAFAERTRSRAEQGVAMASFSDPSTPMFIDPAAGLRLTPQARQWMEADLTKGRRKFENECGDSVIVGKDTLRFFNGVAYFEQSASESEKDKQLKLEAAVKYMRSSGKVSTELSQQEKRSLERSSIKVSYLASGDYEGSGATDIASFAETFRRFSNAPRSSTSALRNIYIVTYKDLLPASEFKLDLSRRQLARTKKIVNAMLLIERARNVARAEQRSDPGGGAKGRAQRLTRELNQFVRVLQAHDACIGDQVSPACENLEQRAENFPRASQRAARQVFVRNATTGQISCTGYPVSRPDGQPLCMHCEPGREPSFLRQANGACRYITLDKPKPGSERLFMHTLKVGITVSGGEAGVYTSVASYPNFCAKPGKQCRQEAAEQWCRSKGFAKATDFQVWDPPQFLEGPALRTHYVDGTRCKSDAGSFERTSCKPMKYVDCSRVE